MNAKDIEDLFRLFKHMSMTAGEQRDHFAYSSMSHEIEYHTKFASWVRQSYPDVWEAWRAIQDVENSAKTEVGMQTGWNR